MRPRNPCTAITVSVFVATLLVTLGGVSEAKRNVFRKKPDLIIKREDFVRAPESMDEQIHGRFSCNMLRTPNISSVSVIVLSKNQAYRLEDTLKSVAESILHLLETSNNVTVDVVIVDDASVDDSRNVITAFVENEKNKGHRNPEWKALFLYVEVLPGTARNLAISQSKGDVLSFITAGDLYYNNHISSCVDLLGRNSKHLFAKTGTIVDFPLHPDWKTMHTSDISLAACVFRRFHDFVGGFPEGMWQDFRDDMFYQEAAFTVLDQLDNDIAYDGDIESVRYRFPDKFRYKVFLADPNTKPEIKKYTLGLPPALYPNIEVQRVILAQKVEELKRRMYNFELGNADGVPFSYWAPYSVTLKEFNIPLRDFSLAAARGVLGNTTAKWLASMSLPLLSEKVQLLSNKATNVQSQERRIEIISSS